MVPVPEELVEQVQQYLAWGAEHQQALAKPSWDKPAIEQLYRLADPAGRRLLASVAAAVCNGGQVTVAEAARTVGVNEREIVGLCVELNYLVPENGQLRAVLLVGGVPPGEELVAGGAKLLMDPRVAALVDEVATAAGESGS
jgi:hypothetical protein